jgi:hypothetical protein
VCPQFNQHGNLATRETVHFSRWPRPRMTRSGLCLRACRHSAYPFLRHLPFFTLRCLHAAQGDARWVAVSGLPSKVQRQKGFPFFRPLPKNTEESNGI